MKQHVLFIHGAGRGSYKEDGLLVASLRKALGPAYTVRYPKMVNEEDPYKQWKAQIASELARLDGEVILVGHSVGGSVILKFLSESRVEKVAGLFLIAAPHWGGDDYWSWDEVALPRNVAAKLAYIPRIFLYHSRDDKVVPFAHLGLYEAKIPRATIRAVDGRGHQFGNDLADVAGDIRRAEMKSLAVKKAIEIDAPASKVWDIIASPKTWKQWMLVVPEVENDRPFGVGSKVLWKDGGNAYLTGTVTSFEPKKKFVLELQDVSWTRKAKPGEVTYTLTLSEKDRKTRLAFTLGDLSIDPEAQRWHDAYNESRELEVIKSIAEGQKPKTRAGKRRR